MRPRSRPAIRRKRRQDAFWKPLIVVPDDLRRPATEAAALREQHSHSP
jgi:hypothetical protein